MRPELLVARGGDAGPDTAPTKITIPAPRRGGPAFTAAGAADAVVERTRLDRLRLRHDGPVPLPASRGPVSEALLELLDGDPDRPASVSRLRWSGAAPDAVTDDDLQLALWLSYELGYRGLAGVDEGWEDHPDLLAARRGWERMLVLGLTARIRDRFAVTDPDLDAAGVVGALEELAGADRGPSLSQFLMREATARQFAEFLVHRSIYHLKEADPHTWAIPRLSGAVKAAMITIQLDEYGLGETAAMHAQLFRRVLQDWHLADRYGAHLDKVPGLTLLATNVISLFGLHRRWRGALTGHLALFEMTSSTPNARYARGHRRLGGGEQAAAFFDEHVVADAVHEQIAAHRLAGGLARTEPALAGQIVFGAQTAALVDDLFAEHALGAWRAGRSSLRRRLDGVDA